MIIAPGGTEGFLAVDSAVNGRCYGGVRMSPDVSEEELRLLARSMTLKFGFLGLPHGGAKAGIRWDPEGPERERRRMIREFGRALAPLLRRGVYNPGPDMGTTNEDVRELLSAAGVRTRRPEPSRENSGYYTALSVFESARAAGAFVGIELRGAPVAVEGFGKVGSALALLLAEAGAKVVAISTSGGALYNPRGFAVHRLVSAARTRGSRVVECQDHGTPLQRELLVELPVAYLFPCAHHHSIREGNAQRVKARIVCPGANNPTTPGAGKILHGRGILCVPDFVANAGGVLGGTMEFAGIPPGWIRKFIRERYGRKVFDTLAAAYRRGIPPQEAAEEEAEARVVRIARRAARRSAGLRVFASGLAAYRAGMLPRRLVGMLSILYFSRLFPAMPRE
ncbi:Glu/Leu/Phe/Val dehydrogenase dimerization domain-containing protein [Deferrisoma sp.]